MAPKKAAGTGAAKTPSHPSYKDMIKEAILALKERNGSSRQALKKYILANHKTSAGSQAVFDQQFNKALRTGVEKGDFTQPKGSSGPVKLGKKEPAKKPAAKKPAAKKATGTTTKKATTAKPKAKTATTTKKATTTTKKAAATPKANTGTKRKTAAPAAAPAVVDVPKVISKTKSGRVTKTPAKATAKKPAQKKTTKKSAGIGPKKTGAPGPDAAA